jgi:hypothetical protein
MTNNKQQNMKTPIENLIAWLKLHHPDSVPSQTEIERWVMAEKIENQMAYNAGFSNAKRIYQIEGVEL